MPQRGVVGELVCFYVSNRAHLVTVNKRGTQSAIPMEDADTEERP